LLIGFSPDLRKWDSETLKKIDAFSNMPSKVVENKSDAKHPTEHGNPITSLAVSFVLFQRWPRFSTNSHTALVNVFAVSRLCATSPHGTFRVLHGELPAVLRIPGCWLKNQ